MHIRKRINIKVAHSPLCCASRRLGKPRLPEFAIQNLVTVPVCNHCCWAPLGGYYCPVPSPSRVVNFKQMEAQHGVGRRGVSP
jgi:hypothetical protein